MWHVMLYISSVGRYGPIMGRKIILVALLTCNGTFYRPLSVQVPFRSVTFIFLLWTLQICSLLLSYKMMLRMYIGKSKRRPKESESKMTWWRHDMKTLSALLAIWEGSSQKGLMMRNFVIFLLLAWTRYWANSQVVVDLGSHDTDVISL